MTIPGDRPRTLRDVGEFALLESVVFPMARRYGVDADLGDDCGFVEIGGALIAVSADAGPRPLVQQLSGHETDYEAAGWHAVVATASDIATAGAKPLFLVDTIDAPPDLPVPFLQAFMDGYFRACAEFGFQTVGGDIRQGSVLTARVFGVGLVEHGARIGRRSAAPGDHVVLIGGAGAFISAFLFAERQGHHRLSSNIMEILRFPRPQLREMQVLAKHCLVSAASDSSDGVLGALENIGKQSQCGFHLNLDAKLLDERITNEASIRGFDPWNIFFCWGDWSVVAVVPQGRLLDFSKVASDHSIVWIPLGQVVHGPFSLHATVDGIQQRVRVLRNENFVKTGFHAGLGSHINHMLATKLFT